MKKRFAKILFWLVAITSVVISGFVIAQCNREAKLQAGIADEIIRFHVRANSDSDEDQKIKMEVKKNVVDYICPILSNSNSVEESKNILLNHQDDIKEVALNTLKSMNCDYDVSVYMEKSYFPMKSYGDIMLPPGDYEAFRIDIGEASGKNWWCVLFPPLCFVDVTYGVVPEDSKAQLKQVLTEDEYNVVTGSSNENITYKFKYFTFLNKLIEKSGKG
ncbi:MAG: stage II sporulation protein R [Eubacteriales bacterium]|nr:stage II sporulation protein R [Eubacteriales bacterium]